MFCQSKLHSTEQKPLKRYLFYFHKKRHTSAFRDAIEVQLAPLSSHLQVTIAETSQGKQERGPREICKSFVSNWTGVVQGIPGEVYPMGLLH